MRTTSKLVIVDMIILLNFGLSNLLTFFYLCYLELLPNIGLAVIILYLRWHGHWPTCYISGSPFC
jgi:hypothetical protein